jgi:predicted SAM-dependent methyltransferase
MAPFLNGFGTRLRQEHPDLVRIFRLLRYEVQLANVTIKSVCSLRQWKVKRRLSRECELKVQFGSGPSPVPGWINIDGGHYADVQLDLRRRLPLQAESVAYIFTEHFLDHLQFPDGVGHLLRECRRVLKPGGTMRVVVHDGERLLRACVEKDAEFFRGIADFDLPDENVSSLMAYVNHIFRFNGFHQFIYDYETLERQFLNAGFTSVQRSSFRGSSLSELNLDLDLPDRAPQSLYVEAVK